MEKQLDIRRPVPQKHHGLSTVSKIFFGVDIFQVVIVVVFQSTMIACGNFNAYNSPENPGMGPGRRIYMCVYMGVIVYTCFLCLFAVKEKNFLEILAFLLQNFGFVAYGLIQVYHVGYKEHPRGKGSNATVQHSPLLRNIALTNSLVLFLLNGVFIFLSWKLYIEFGWKIYKRVRFNLSLRSVYHYYQFLICLLKMAIMYWWMYAICNSFVLLRDYESVMYFINLAFIPMSVVYACMGYIATRREVKPLMVIFILWTFGVIGYFLYKLYGFITDTCTGCQEFHITGKDIHDEAILHFVYLGTLNFLILLAILGVACKVLSNFGKGLAQHFKPHNDKRPRAGTDLDLRRGSHYVEESVVSATSYESEHDELQDSTRLSSAVYQQLTLTTGAPLLNTNARILASSMPNLFESAQKSRTFPVSKEIPKPKEDAKPSAINSGIINAMRCSLAVIDEDDDITKDVQHTPPTVETSRKTSEMNGHRKNEIKELLGNKSNDICTNGTNGRPAVNPSNKTLKTWDTRVNSKHKSNGISTNDDENDDVFTVDKRTSRDSGFIESPRDLNNKDNLRTRKTPIIYKDSSSEVPHKVRNGRECGSSVESGQGFKPNRIHEIKKKLSLSNEDKS